MKSMKFNLRTRFNKAIAIVAFSLTAMLLVFPFYKSNAGVGGCTQYTANCSLYWWCCNCNGQEGCQEETILINGFVFIVFQ
jgi:hypothetical protein